MVSCKGIFVSEQVCSVKGSKVSSRLRRLSMQIQAKSANVFRRTLFFLNWEFSICLVLVMYWHPLLLKSSSYAAGKKGTVASCWPVSDPTWSTAQLHGTFEPCSAHKKPAGIGCCDSLRGADTCPLETGLRPDLRPTGPTERLST